MDQFAGIAVDAPLRYRRGENPGNEERSEMETAEYAAMAEVESTYWWHVGRQRIVRAQLARQFQNTDGALRLLNVGCGTGGDVSMLESFGTVDNVDIAEEALSFMRARGHERVHRADATHLPFPDDHFDAVVALDVLEHLVDDRAALTEWRRVLKPGGCVVLTVPAYQWLWSEHDVALHHQRRYARRVLHDRAREADLVIRKLTHAIVFSLPLIVGYRLLKGLRREQQAATSTYVPVPRAANRLFIRLLTIEAALHGWVRFPVGTSLLGVLVRPVEAAESDGPSAGTRATRAR
jgi:ubiquinone/menaquinone biosynthesis C-methylase UbiE